MFIVDVWDDGRLSNQSEDSGPMSLDKQGEARKLHDDVVSSRDRLRLAEENHERALVGGSSSEVVEIGREYAAAVQGYSAAVMAWLSWLKRHRPRR